MTTRSSRPGPDHAGVRAIDGLMRLTRGACGLGFAAFCGVTLVQVINRYLLGWSMFWTEELVLLLFVWSVMLGMPAALWWREEIVVDIIQLPSGFDGLRRVMVELVSVAFLIALLWSGIGFMLRGGISMSPALGLPRSVFYASIPTGAVLALFALAGRMMRRREPSEAVAQDAAVAHD